MVVRPTNDRVESRVDHVQSRTGASPMKSLTERHRALAPFDQYELKLVRLALSRPGVLHPRHEAALRYALALARLVQLRLPDGKDFDTTKLTAGLRERVE